MSNELIKLCRKGSELIYSFSKDTRIRVISHYDADGICAAAIICKALHREAFDFHVSLLRNPFDKAMLRLSKEENELIIFTDMGSGQIEKIEDLNSMSIILDHHQSLKQKSSDNVLQINASLCGIDGNFEICGSTLAYTFSKTLNKKNIDLITLAIIGATGDKQYIGGFRGYNKTIIDEGLKKGIIYEKTEMKLWGNSIYDCLYYSTDPFYFGISGNKNGVNNLLHKLNLNNNASIDEIDKYKKKKLNSFLMLQLIKQGCEKNILDTIIRKRFFTNKAKYELEGFADLLDSCGKGGNRGLGLCAALGDKNSLKNALKIEKSYKKKILDGIITLVKNGFKDKKNFRYFYSNDSSLGGVIAGIAANFLTDNKKPLFSIVKNQGELHISCRGNQYLIRKGLDLGIAMKKVARNLGGQGGGHAIASGATIELSREEEFLKMVDDIITKQIKV
jgi:RecJ-like exonuclease